MKAATFGPQLQRGNGWRVVEVNVRIAKDFNRMGEQGPLLFLQFACAQAL